MPARWRKNPKAFPASAAEDSGLSNLPRPISLPGAARKIASISSAGTPGSHRFVVVMSTISLFQGGDRAAPSRLVVDGRSADFHFTLRG